MSRDFSAEAAEIHAKVEALEAEAAAIAERPLAERDMDRLAAIGEEMGLELHRLRALRAEQRLVRVELKEKRSPWIVRWLRGET